MTSNTALAASFLTEARTVVRPSAAPAGTRNETENVPAAPVSKVATWVDPKDRVPPRTFAAKAAPAARTVEPRVPVTGVNVRVAAVAPWVGAGTRSSGTETTRASIVLSRRVIGGVASRMADSSCRCIRRSW